MKKILVLLLALLCTSTFLFGCGGAGGAGGNNSSSSNGEQNAAGDGSFWRDGNEHYPDAPVEGENTFSFEKKSQNGKEVTVTLKIGGTQVKLAGFELYIDFEKSVIVKSVNGKGVFSSLSFNNVAAGRLKLVWAAIENVTDSSEICDITFDLGDVTSTKLTMKLPVGGLGYIDEDAVPPVKSVRGTLTEFTLS